MPHASPILSGRQPESSTETSPGNLALLKHTLPGQPAGELEGTACRAPGAGSGPRRCIGGAPVLLRDCSGIGSLLVPCTSLVQPLYIPCTSVPLPQGFRQRNRVSNEPLPCFDDAGLSAILTEPHFSMALLPAAGRHPRGPRPRTPTAQSVSRQGALQM
jgi:hypothetical protein